MGDIGTKNISAFDVADFFIYTCNESGALITNLKLQKVLYYAQGWHLGLFGCPLFDDDFQAWVHGPAIPHVYGEYKKFSFQPINKAAQKPAFSIETEKFLNDLGQVILPIDAYELELATHREAPWIKARNGLPPDASSKNIIEKESMRDFFAKLAVENGENKMESAV
jgi:uncharacterized phage-associated protein